MFDYGDDPWDDLLDFAAYERDQQLYLDLENSPIDMEVDVEDRIFDQWLDEWWGDFDESDYTYREPQMDDPYHPADALVYVGGPMILPRQFINQRDVKGHRHPTRSKRNHRRQNGHWLWVFNYEATVVLPHSPRRRCWQRRQDQRFKHRNVKFYADAPDFTPDPYQVCSLFGYNTPSPEHRADLNRTTSYDPSDYDEYAYENYDGYSYYYDEAEDWAAFLGPEDDPYERDRQFDILYDRLIYGEA
jgi:hypothetical protein